MKIIIPIMQFYPSNAIGANRWNNLSKLLANKFEVEIWTVRREKKETKPLHKNIKIRSFHSDPMFILEEFTVNNFILKIFKIIIIRILSILFWPTDMGEYFPLFIKKEVFKEMNNNSLFIITGGSFALQSKLFKYLSDENYQNFILDYRDVWNTDPHKFYLFSFIKKRAENIEREMLLSEKGKKLFVTKTLAENMICKPINNEIILNGHDFEINDIDNFRKICLRKKKIKKIKIIYLGSIGKGRDKLFVEFIERLNHLNISSEIDLYGSISIKLRNFIHYFKSKKIKIRNLKKVNREKIKSISKNYNIGLQITSDSYPYALSTKLYEYPALGLPQICLCNNGEIKDMIFENKIGVIINSKSSLKEVSMKIDFAINKIDCENLFKFAKESKWENRYKKLIKVIENLQLGLNY